MSRERGTKPVDVWDHTNVMGCVMACMLLTPFMIGFFAIIALIIHALHGASAWIMLPVTIVAVPAMWGWIFAQDSTWTREEAAERGSEWDNNQ